MMATQTQQLRTPKDIFGERYKYIGNMWIKKGFQLKTSELTYGYEYNGPVKIYCGRLNVTEVPIIYIQFAFNCLKYNHYGDFNNIRFKSFYTKHTLFNNKQFKGMFPEFYKQHEDLIDNV
jgi:hypothetical protein